MNALLENEAFASDFRALERVSLDPSRHAAPNAKVHSEWVAERAMALGRANGRSESELQMLHDLGLAHDIGKASGTTAPAKSVERLDSYGSQDPQLLSRVKYHDWSRTRHSEALEAK